MAKENQLIIQLRGFDAKHYTKTERYAKQVAKLYQTAADEFANLAGKISLPADGTFNFDDFPKAKKQARGIVSRLAGKIEAIVTTGQRSEWLAACQKNDAFLASILHTSKLSKEEAERYQERNLEALSAFQNRKEGGLNLSQKVWKYAGEFKDAMELGIDIGLGDGKSAQELSRDLRKYLNEPDRLYRRVRDKGGNLRLSKAAKLYHPGQGVYRSSAKNAQRLTRTEVNMAYRESEYLRWQQLDFVVGVRVMLSNNHTIKNSKGEPVPFVDICDTLAGDYPKTFKFVGWHPQCRCFVVPIMSDYDEYNKDRANRLKAIVKGAQYKSLPSRRTIKDVPQAFRDYVSSIEERAKGWKSMPYYIRDNFKGGKISGGLSRVIPQKKVEPCTEFDSTISSLRRWAYAFGGDLSAIDTLRTAGNRTALAAEIERVQSHMDSNQEKWNTAKRALYAFIESELLSNYIDLADKYARIYNQNEIKPSNYYGDCIPKLQQALIDAKEELQTVKAEEAKQEYSKNMPGEFKKGKEWLRGDDYTFEKDFFDLIDPNNPVPVTIHKGNSGAYYSPGEKRVHLDYGNRTKESAWERKSVVYHEFGHAIDWQRGLRFSNEVKELREKQIARLKKKVTTTKKTSYYDGVLRQYVTKESKTQTIYAKVLSERLDRIYSKIRFMKDETFAKRGITKDDVIEQICSVQDTLKSLIKTVGWGHSTSYFKKPGLSEAEYIAHCFENTFIGNRVFQKYLPTEYAETIAFIKSLNKP